MQNAIQGGISSRQQSLFTGQQANSLQQSSQSQSSGASQKSNDSSGNIKQQAQVSVLESSMETQSQNAKKLIESSVGIGQNVDTVA